MHDGITSLLTSMAAPKKPDQHLAGSSSTHPGVPGRLHRSIRSTSGGLADAHGSRSLQCGLPPSLLIFSVGTPTPTMHAPTCPPEQVGACIVGVGPLVHAPDMAKSYQFPAYTHPSESRPGGGSALFRWFPGLLSSTSGAISASQRSNSPLLRALVDFTGQRPSLLLPGDTPAHCLRVSASLAACVRSCLAI